MKNLKPANTEIAQTETDRNIAPGFWTGTKTVLSWMIEVFDKN